MDAFHYSSTNIAHIRLSTYLFECPFGNTTSALGVVSAEAAAAALALASSEGPRDTEPLTLFRNPFIGQAKPQNTVYFYNKGSAATQNIKQLIS